MANYDDVIAKNKKYLTNAQVNALVAASKEYNIQNAGNRAGALASAREQYDAGYRALQNMGLAGATNAQPTSGEVPRLQAQVQAPFDSYNRSLRETENKRLNALGGQFAQQTRRARAAAAAAQLAAQQQAAADQVRQAENEMLNRINAAKQQVAQDAATKAQQDGLKRTLQEKANIYNAATKAQLDGIKRTAQVQQQTDQNQAALRAAAEVLGVKTTTGNASAANAAQDRGVKLTQQLGGNTDTSTKNVYRNMTNQERAEQTRLERATQDTGRGGVEAQKALNAFKKGLNAGFEKGEAEQQLADAQKKVDALNAVRDTDAWDVPDDVYQQAVQQRNAAKLKAEDPLTYSFIVVANSNVDPDIKRNVGEKFINANFEDDKEDAAQKYNSALDTVNRMEAQLRKEQQDKETAKEEAANLKEKVGTLLRDLDAAKESGDLGKIHTARQALYAVTNPKTGQGFDEKSARSWYWVGDTDEPKMDPDKYKFYKSMLDIIDSDYKTPEDKALLENAPEDFNEADAREYVSWYESENAPQEEPAQLKQAREDLAAAELRYKYPDAYKAMRIYQYRDLLNQTNPDVVKWANDKIADYQMMEMGIKAPTMTDAEYRSEAELMKGLRRAYNNWQNSRSDAAEAALEKELKDKYGVTPEQAKERLDKFDTEKDARLENDYYRPGMVALMEHQGETPTRLVNTKETDQTYRLVNGLDWMATDENVGIDTSAVKYMTPEQKDAYNSIYEREGIEAANKYARDITPYLNIQRAQQDEAYYKQLADEHPFVADIVSVGANFLWNVPATMERLLVGAENALGADKYYDVNSDWSFRSGRADIIRSERSQNILSNMSRPEWVNNVLNFAYQTGMSMADSGVAMTFAYAGAPWMVDALFFSSAGNAAYKEAKERGATQEQAMEIGILSGAAEAIFEHASIEHFMKLDYKGKGALIKNLLSQATAEGSEEVSTEIANMLTDAWVMRDKSKYAQAVKDYKSQGMSDEQAQNKAFMDQLADIGMAGLGGWVSGGLFALGGAAVSSVRYNKEGKRLNENTQVRDRVVQLAELMGGNAQEALDAYNADKTNRNLGELSATVQQNMRDMFGKETPDVSKTAAMQNQASVPRANVAGSQIDLDAAVRDMIVDKATAYSAMLSGDKMVAATAQAILDVLGRDQLTSMGYDASSAMKLMSSYNKRLDQYAIKSQADTLATGLKPIRSTYQSQVRNSPSSKGMVRAGAALTQAQQRATTENFVRAESQAVNRVWENPTQGLAQNVNGRTVTPMPGNMTAVSLAEQQRTNFKANATATTGKVTYAVAGMQAREGMTNEQTLDEIKKGLTKEARAKANFYEKLAKALGMKMTIHDVMVGTNGFIDENGNMHVVLSGKQSVLRVAAHELTHFMQQNAAEHYAQLRKYLIAEVGQDTFDRMIKQKAREYGIDLSTDKGKAVADDEVCAELCERMLSNEAAIERFAERNTAAAKTLKDHLLKILNAIKAALKDAKNRDFGASWSDLISDQDTVEQWLDGITTAIQNAEKRAQTNEGQIGKVAGTTIADQNALIEDIKEAKTDADVDKAFAEHSADIIEYDMAGYKQDLVDSGIMTNNELETLFDTMNKAIDKVKAHRAILDFGFQLSEEAQNDPELAEKEIAEAKAGRSYLPYKQNADPHYKLALDFSTLCKKRILLQMIQERLQGKLGRALSALETIAVRREIQKLQKNGVDVEVACALCYVEAARLKSPKVINEFLGVGLSKADRAKNVEAEMKNHFAQKDKDIKKTIDKEQKKWKVEKLGADWRGKDKKGKTVTAEKATKDHLKAFGGQELVDEYNNYSKSLRTGKLVSDALKREQQAVIEKAKRLVEEAPETFLNAESLAKLKKSDPDIFYAFTNKVRSATRSKALETDTFYSRGDIAMVEDAIIRTANQESGFRHQSWSDFMPIHLLDTMASIIEMSTRQYKDENGKIQTGAKMHAYTKVPEMVRLLGNTGMMLNLSLIPTGQTGLVNGELDFDSTEGMDFNTMLKLRDMFPNTVGNIAIGISDEQIQKLLASDDIDYVIPYHVSGLNKELRKHMGIHSWLDFTSSQNESEAEGKAPSGRTWKEEHKAKKMKPPALKDWFDEKSAKAAGSNGIEFMQQAAQKYLDICARDGWVPKFSQYLDYDAKANKYTPKAGYENYWKTLTDRKMVNQKTGEVIIQQAVKPKFDQATVMDILNGEAENPTAIRNAAAADEIATELGKTWRGDRENANLKSYKDELNAFREASAVMAADRVKDAVKKALEKNGNRSSSEDLEASESNVRYSLADEDLARVLDEDEMVPVYRAMQVIGGKLYPPMAAKVADEEGGRRQLVEPTEIGKWYVADERPDLIDPKTGKWKLDKANGSTIEAAYNPYFHTSLSALNDQFSSAYKRPNLVVVEGYVPKSELTSGYKAQYAKDPVGAMRWHSGPVSSHLSTPRTVILSRYFKANRILSDVEVASKVADLVKGENVIIPQNTVTPGLYAELQKLGVPTTASYSLDLEELSEIDNGVRYSLNAKKGHRSVLNGAASATTKYKPAGKEPRVREVMVPEVASNGKRVSDFVRSFLESDKATDEMVADLQDKIENGDWGSYTRLTNKEAMATAQSFIANRTLSKAQEEFHDMVKSGRYNVQTRAIGLQLLAEAAQRGDSEAVLNIATDLRELATDAGQSVQIFNVLKGLGGVGSAWYMQKKIDALNAKYADRIAAGKMNEITVSKDLMQDLMDAKTTAEVEAAEDEIAKEIARQLPLTWESRIANWRYLAMLGNPTTHFRNITGNFFMAGMNMTKDAVAATIERFAVRDSSKRAHALLTLKDRQTWGGFAESSYKEQKNALRGSGKFGFETQLRQYMRSFDTKWLNKIAQYNFEKLESEDMKFIRPAYKNALMQYMKAQGYQLKDGVAGKMVDGQFKAITTEQMNAAREWASNQAWKATFHDASVVADMLNSASKKLGPVGNVLIEGVMPFKKTPINIAKRGLEYSPAGIIMGAVKLMKDVKTGKVTVADAIDNIASGITGMTLMALGAFLAKSGFLRAGGDDKKKKETYLTDTGDQTYSLKIGDVSIGLSALAPATIPLFIGAALYDALDKNGEGLDLSAVTETAANALNPFMEMSFMSSLNSALKNYNNNGIGGALGNTLLTAAESYGSQFLPTVVAKTGQVFDPLNRTTKSSAASKVGSGLDYYGRSLAKKIPGLEATLQPDVDVWGRTNNTFDSFGKWALDFANKFIFPVNVKIANKDEVDDELIRVVESTGNADILPSDGPKYFTVKGEKYPMTAAQYTEYSQERGYSSYAAIKETMGADAYQDATDEEKAEMLSNALSAAQKHVDTVWKEKLGATEPVQEEPEKPKTEVQATEGEYSDPALYKVAASYPKAYDKAAKAKAKGISPDTFLSLYEKKDSYSGDDLSTYTRQEIMNSNLTAQQKEFMDDLIVSDKGWNPDYSSKAWFDVSMLGTNAKDRQAHYEEAKEGAKIGLTPETYVQVYNKWRTIDAKDENGRTVNGLKKKRAKEYLDSLAISAPVYQYIWTVMFGYK